MDNAAYWYEKALSYGADEWFGDLNGPNHLLYWFLYRVYLDGRGVEKNYAKASSNLITFIEKGGIWDGTEWNRLGDLFFMGDESLDRDFVKSMAYYQRSIDTYGEDFWPLTGIGRCLYALKSYSSAVEYFMKVVGDDDYGSSAEAMRYLSRCYRYGRGVEQNSPKADYWHNKALEAGDPEAMALANLVGDM